MWQNMVGFVMLVFTIICLLRAKFGKKYVPSKFFYTLLIAGETIISIIGSMYVGYSNFGDSELIKINSTSVLLPIMIAFVYAILVGIIFNLNTIKSNIIKIFITFLTFPFIILMSSFGLFLSMIENVNNLLVAIILLVISVSLFVVRRYSIFNKNLKTVIYFIIVTCMTFSFVFFSNLIFAYKYIASEKEVQNVKNILQDNLNVIIGENKWEIIKLRKGNPPESIMGLPSGDLLLTINYAKENGVNDIEYKIDITSEYIKYVPLGIVLRKANEALPKETSMYFNSPPSEEQIQEIFNEMQKINLTILNFSLDKFLNIVSNDIYIECSELSIEEVRKVVGSQIEIRPYEI